MLLRLLVFILLLLPVILIFLPFSSFTSSISVSNACLFSFLFIASLQPLFLLWFLLHVTNQESSQDELNHCLLKFHKSWSLVFIKWAGISISFLYEQVYLLCHFPELVLVNSPDASGCSSFGPITTSGTIHVFLVVVNAIILSYHFVCPLLRTTLSSVSPRMLWRWLKTNPCLKTSNHEMKATQFLPYK